MKTVFRLASIECLFASPASAAYSGARDEEKQLELGRKDLWLATVAWRIATRAGPLCPNKRPLTDLLVNDAAQYAADLRAATDLFVAGADVEAVVPGSPMIAGFLGVAEFPRRRDQIRCDSSADVLVDVARLTREQR